MPTYWLPVWKDLFVVPQFQQIHICSCLGMIGRIFTLRDISTSQLPFLSSAYSLTRQLTLLARMTCTQIPKIEFRGFFHVRYLRLVLRSEFAKIRFRGSSAIRQRRSSVHLHTLATMNSPQLSHC